MKKVLAIIGAAAAGVVAGILVAPKSGKETREDLKNKANDMKDKAQKTADDVRKKADKLKDESLKKADEVKKDASTVVDDWKARAGRVLETAKDEFNKQPIDSKKK